MSARTSVKEDAVLAALASRPDATTVELAEATGLGRSTVGKVLAALERRGQVRRSVGGRERGRRLPDRWALGEPKKPARRAATAKRLRSGELDALVVDYLSKHGQDGPLSPTAVAKGLGRSGGAVANCLARLAGTGRVRQVGGRPRRYSPV